MHKDRGSLEGKRGRTEDGLEIFIIESQSCTHEVIYILLNLASTRVRPRWIIDSSQNINMVIEKNRGIGFQVCCTPDRFVLGVPIESFSSKF